VYSVRSGLHPDEAIPWFSAVHAAGGADEPARRRGRAAALRPRSNAPSDPSGAKLATNSRSRRPAGRRTTGRTWIPIASSPPGWLKTG